MNKKLVLMVTIFLCLNSFLYRCDAMPTASPATETPTEEPDFIEVKDITYDSEDDVDLKLDLAYPTEGTGPYPAIIFIFGGGWSSGGRDAFGEHIQWAAEKDYVVVAIDYRLLNRMSAGEFLYPFPAQIQDPKCAVQWLRANAEEYKIDQDRIGAAGYGSGSHLALLLALTDESDGLEGDCDFPGYSSRI